jgi:hypothetical protein
MNPDARDPGEIIGADVELMLKQTQLWRILSPRQALGWATVELERGLRDVSTGFSRYGTPTESDVPDEDVLGARCRLLTFGEDFSVVILEPKTEGRIAAALARHGEGTVVMYTLIDDDLDHVSRRLVRAGLELGPPRTGPFGPECLVVGNQAWGPFLILAADERQPATNQQPVTIET